MKLSNADRRAQCWGLPVPEGLGHGMNTVAKKFYGCDCSVCLPSGQRRPPKGEGKGLAQRQRESRERLRGKPVPDHVRHGPYAYKVYRCRCDVCVARRHEAVAAMAAKKRRGRGHWHDDVERGVTVVHWPPADLSEPWLCPTCDYKIIP